MAEHAAFPTELMRSLGRLVRGLSALFWGLPISFLVCFYTAKADLFSRWTVWGVVPPLIGTGLVLYGLCQMAGFQKQERVWRTTLDRATLLGAVVFGLSPFLYWWNQVPGNSFFLGMTSLMAFGGMLLLGAINRVLRRLGAMLPDEALREETRQYAALNLGLLTVCVLLAAIYVAVVDYNLNALTKLPDWMVNRESLWFLIPLALLPPLAMTMAMIWKTKEVILDGVFGGK